jgi:hypothetical protein
MHLRQPVGSTMPQDGRVQPNEVAEIARGRQAKRITKVRSDERRMEAQGVYPITKN